MFISKKHLPRRTFLQGLGRDGRRCRCSTRWCRPSPPRLTQSPRLGFVYVPHGMVMSRFTPDTAGKGFEFKDINRSLEPYRDRLSIVSRLHHRAADSTAVHSLSPTTWLSGVRPKPTQGVDALRRHHGRPDRRAARSARTRCCRRWSSRPRTTRA